MPCPHTLLLNSLCTLCGSYIKDTSSVQALHSNNQLKYSQEEALQKAKENLKSLNESRKLVLVLDLDQTILHTSIDVELERMIGIYFEEINVDGSVSVDDEFKFDVKEVVKNDEVELGKFDFVSAVPKKKWVKTFSEGEMEFLFRDERVNDEGYEVFDLIKYDYDTEDSESTELSQNDSNVKNMDGNKNETSEDVDIINDKNKSELIKDNEMGYNKLNLTDKISLKKEHFVHDCRGELINKQNDDMLRNLHEMKEHNFMNNVNKDKNGYISDRHIFKGEDGINLLIESKSKDQMDTSMNDYIYKNDFKNTNEEFNSKTENDRYYKTNYEKYCNEGGKVGFKNFTEKGLLKNTYLDLLNKHMDDDKFIHDKCNADDNLINFNEKEKIKECDFIMNNPPRNSKQIDFDKNTIHTFDKNKDCFLDTKDYHDCKKLKTQPVTLPLTPLYTYTLHEYKYYTRTRPFLTYFLDSLLPFYQMHVYTNGNRLYANNIIKIIDPTGKYFADRVITRDESPGGYKDLKKLFVFDENVVILDDRADVWRFVENLILIRPFFYFVEGDVNFVSLNKDNRKRFLEMKFKRKKEGKVEQINVLEDEKGKADCLKDVDMAPTTLLLNNSCGKSEYFEENNVNQNNNCSDYKNDCTNTNVEKEKIETDKKIDNTKPLFTQTFDVDDEFNNTKTVNTFVNQIENNTQKENNNLFLLHPLIKDREALEPSTIPSTPLYRNYNDTDLQILVPFLLDIHNSYFSKNITIPDSLKNSRKQIFNNLNFYVADGNVAHITKIYLCTLIRQCGGNIKCSAVDYIIAFKYTEEVDVIYKIEGCDVLSYKWVLECVYGLKKLSCDGHMIKEGVKQELEDEIENQLDIFWND